MQSKRHDDGGGCVQLVLEMATHVGNRRCKEKEREREKREGKNPNKNAIERTTYCAENPALEQESGCSAIVEC